MNTYTKMAWLITGSILMGGAATATPTATPSPATPQSVAGVGKPAPTFQLIDTDGNTHSYSDYAGKIIVLEWFGSACQFSGKDTTKSIHATGRAEALQKQLKEIDPTVVYLLIDSTARRNTKEEVIAANRAAKKKWKIESPILIDFDGAVGHAYRAQTTPHMFVVDTKGVLRYHGAFDTNKRGDTKDSTNHVLEAVKKIKAGQSPSPSQTSPWGCSVKFAP
ncbi:MAG: redoxin domain-containing protein [Phycisphaerae bacterium]|nr:redoxin domain-containing protein [Phycisphaerae bacterium]